MKDNWKRIALGLLVLLLVDYLGGYLPPTVSPERVQALVDSEWGVLLLTLKGIVVLFVAAAAGGFIARRSFLLPAVVLVGGKFVFVSGLSFVRMYRRTIEFLEEIGQTATLGELLWPVVWSNLKWLCMVLAVTALGALAGMLLARHYEQRAAAG